jgi:predicted DCC family thiol-disulfide oxidoreductase YuxK
VAFVQFFKRHIASPLTILSLDLRAMAAFRFLLGFILIVDVMTRATDIRSHYSDFGIVPRHAYIEHFSNPLHVSLHLASGLVEWQALLFALTALAGFCVMIGYRTRFATIVAWILLVSMHNRNTMILNGGDVLFRVMYFWSIMLPLGARYSVDAALNSSPSESKKLFFSAATIGISVQIAILYVSTALLKTGKEWWPEGTASYYALQLDSFVTPFGMWMGKQVELLKMGTYFVYFLELFAGLLIFVPIFFQQIRLLVVVALMFMHFNFDLTMRLGIFPWVDIIALSILIPSSFWDWCSKKIKTNDRLNLKIYYDGDCNFCRKIAVLIKEFLLIKETEVSTVQSADHIKKLSLDANSWVVVDEKNNEYVRWEALVVVFEHIPVFGNLIRYLPLRSLRPLGDRGYKIVAKNRSLLGKVSAILLPWRQISDPVAGPITTFLAVFFTGYIVIWNLRTLPQFNIEMEEKWRRIANVLRLDQKWNMFAPFPLKADGWFVMEGVLKDGSTWDIMKGEPGPVSYEKPEYPAYQYPNARWRKYLMNINQKKRRTYRLYFGKYTCRNFNTGMEGDKMLAKFELVFMKELSRPPGEPLTSERISLWKHDCFKTSSD